MFLRKYEDNRAVGEDGARRNTKTLFSCSTFKLYFLFVQYNIVQQFSLLFLLLHLSRFLVIIVLEAFTAQPAFAAACQTDYNLLIAIQNKSDLLTIREAKKCRDLSLLCQLSC